MPSAAVMKVLLREVLAFSSLPRQTEPALVMDDEKQVADYVEAGLEGGVMAPVYLFHCANICEVIRPGDRVLDLACGPANQLAMVARLNPETRFVGIDLSEPMLERARALVARQGLKNVEFRLQNIADLSGFEQGSFDGAISTMALHHLPDAALLTKTFNEVARVLRPDAGIYLTDFGRLKTETSIEYFATQYQDKQPDLFTIDYRNSLHAAFSVDEFRRAASALKDRARLYTTFLSPFMMVLKSPKRQRADDSRVAQGLREARDDLPVWHQTDYADLKTFFRLGGLKCSYI